MSTTFRVFSDLHLEGNPAAAQQVVRMCEDKPKDVVILAGDICTYSEPKCLRMLEKLVHSHEHIVYVIGNHEYYGFMEERWKGESAKPVSDVVDLHRETADEIGFVMLEQESYLAEDHVPTPVLIHGCTMWSPVSGLGFACMRDRLYLSKPTIHEMHAKSLTFLDDAVLKARGIPQVICTHHMPSYSLVDQMYREQDNSGFASEQEKRMRGYKEKGVGHWVYGHTHARRESVVSGVQTHCNPLGYKGEINGEYLDMGFEVGRTQILSHPHTLTPPTHHIQPTPPPSNVALLLPCREGQD